jgi:peptidoglycan/xylan/chitin deacetylase (PgdA/CDA1 family)
MKKRIRNIFASFVARGLFIIGLDKKVVKSLLHREVILPIYFHNPNKEEFSEAIKYLKNLGFGFIGIDELRQVVNKEVPFPKGKVFISVDDGWDSNYDNMVPIAEAEKVPITIFATTEAIEQGNYWFNYAKAAKKMELNYPSKNSLKKLPNSERMKIVEKIKKEVNLGREAMTVSQLQLIDNLPYVRIEAHSHVHPILPNCTDEELQQDLSTCKTKLESWLKRPLTAFAYPNGDFGTREMRLLKELGFSLGFANNPSFIDPNNMKDVYKLPRIGFLEGASTIENRCRMLGLWHRYTLKVFKN